MASETQGTTEQDSALRAMPSQGKTKGELEAMKMSGTGQMLDKMGGCLGLTRIIFCIQLQVTKCNTIIPHDDIVLSPTNYSYNYSVIIIT